MRLQHRAELDLLDQVGVEERHVERDRDLDLVAVDGDLDALRLEGVELGLACTGRASVSISNSPWIWLCARYPTVANSLLRVALTLVL